MRRLSSRCLGLSGQTKGSTQCGSLHGVFGPESKARQFLVWASSLLLPGVCEFSSCVVLLRGVYE